MRSTATSASATWPTGLWNKGVTGMANFSDMDALLQKFVDDGLPGCGCVIAKKGEVLYENYFGYADVENRVPLTAEHVFRQASLTKIAMYTTLMMLYERGEFLMTDPLYEYFPEWKDMKKLVRHPNGTYTVEPTERPVLVRDVFNMTVGLPYEMIMGDVPVSHPISTEMAKVMKPLRESGRFTLREQIRATAQVPLTFEPGTRHLYGFSSELAAGLLEVLEGKAAELVIKENLFEPLGMESSANFLMSDLEERLVKNYYLRPGKRLGEEGALYVSDLRSNGVLGEISGFQRVITNCGDYTKLMQMLANGGKYRDVRLMGRKTIDLMRTNLLTETQLAEDFENSYLRGYGYGYGVRTLMKKYEGQHNGSLGAFGWTGGSGTWAEADPSEGVSIVYMHNLQPNLEEYHHLRMRAVAYGCLA